MLVYRIPPNERNSSKFFKEMNDLNQNLNLRIKYGHVIDYIDAAKNSATFLRIGSKIFGKRS